MAEVYDPNPGRYCCLHPGCDHPRDQVFNGGGGDVIEAHLPEDDRPAWLPTMEFVARYNAAPFRRGKPRAGPLDGMVLLMWHMERKALEIKPSDMIMITGSDHG